MTLIAVEPDHTDPNHNYTMSVSTDGGDTWSWEISPYSTTNEEN